MHLATTIIENISSEDGNQWTYLLTRGLGNWHEICRFDSEGHRASLYSKDNGETFDANIGLETLDIGLPFVRFLNLIKYPHSIKYQPCPTS